MIDKNSTTNNKTFERLSESLEYGLKNAPAYWAENDRVIDLIEKALKDVNVVLAEKFGRSKMEGWPRMYLELEEPIRGLGKGAPLPIFLQGPSEKYEFATVEPLQPVHCGVIERLRVQWMDSRGEWIWETRRGAEELTLIFGAALATPLIAGLLERSSQRFQLTGLE